MHDNLGFICPGILGKIMVNFGCIAKISMTKWLPDFSVFSHGKLFGTVDDTKFTWYIFLMEKSKFIWDSFWSIYSEQSNGFLVEPLHSSPLGFASIHCGKIIVTKNQKNTVLKFLGNMWLNIFKLVALYFNTFLDSPVKSKQFCG